MLEPSTTIPLPDGARLTFGARLLGLGSVGRTPGPDLVEVAVARAANDQMPIFFMGGGPGVVDDLCQALRSRYPGLKVAGLHTPPYGKWPRHESLAMCEVVRESGARILWLGISASKQET